MPVMARRCGKRISDRSVSAGPMTYMVNGKQYVSIQAGSALFTFGLR